MVVGPNIKIMKDISDNVIREPNVEVGVQEKLGRSWNDGLRKRLFFFNILVQTLTCGSV